MNDDAEHEELIKLLQAAFENAKEALKEGGAFYIWHSSSTAEEFTKAAKKSGLSIRQTIIWVKNTFVLGRQDYKWKHEPCLYGWKEGAAHFWAGGWNKPTVIEDQIDIEKMKKDELKKMLQEIVREETPTTVIHENKPVKSEIHPTMKPVKLCARLITNSTRKGDTVLDLFGGSGTTMIAAEQIGRKCYMMELDPKYVDAIIERWESLTGEKAKMEGSNV